MTVDDLRSYYKSMREEPREKNDYELGVIRGLSLAINLLEVKDPKEEGVMTPEEYQKSLDEFYQIEDDDTLYFIHKLDSTESFFRVWDQMVNDPEEVVKLRELFGSEFDHINNHYKKIKDTQ